MREIEEKVIQVSADREIAWQNLNAYLGLPSRIQTKIDWANLPRTLRKEDLTADLGRSNPTRLRQSQRVEVAELGIRQAALGAYPDFRFGAAYTQQRVAADREHSFVGTIELSIPLWNRGTDALGAARFRLDAEKGRAEQVNRELRSEVEKAWVEMAEHQKRADLYPPSLISSLEEQMHVADANWRRGLVTAAALLELESQVHDQVVRVYGTRTDYVDSMLKICSLNGWDVNRLEGN